MNTYDWTTCARELQRQDDCAVQMIARLPASSILLECLTNTAGAHTPHL